jgi:hypothetical protein
MAATASTSFSGPSGFIEFAGLMLLVDYGRIYAEGVAIGFLYDDGYLEDTTGPLGINKAARPIEELAGCIFRGIDSSGVELILPGQSQGPSGGLVYNGLQLTVTSGRLGTKDHGLIGEFNDNGQLKLRDLIDAKISHSIDETTQLNTNFEGVKSTGETWKYEFVRPLFRKDRTYADNEIMRYFVGFDNLTMPQKKYVFETMSLWSASGILQIVRKSEGDASLGNVRHGAAGVTAERTGNATFDKQEFEQEVELFKLYGAFANAAKGIQDYTEVRLNLVVPHEFGHQLEYLVTEATVEKIADVYKQRRKSCNVLHPLPAEYTGESELLRRQEIERRHFISGYARSSMHEYWAECVAAFSVKESRLILKHYDPAVHQLLTDLILRPKNVLRRTFHDTIRDLQTGLRLTGELRDDLLED